MDFLIAALLMLVKLVLAGFVVWGGWLSLSTVLRGETSQAKPARAEPAPQSFERVASLVLLALLCTTFAGLSVPN